MECHWQSSSSSAVVQPPFLMSVLRWLSHRSRHCLPLRLLGSVVSKCQRWREGLGILAVNTGACGCQQQHTAHWVSR
jgi:hypothetical protein